MTFFRHVLETFLKCSNRSARLSGDTLNHSRRVDLRLVVPDALVVEIISLDSVVDDKRTTPTMTLLLFTTIVLATTMTSDGFCKKLQGALYQVLTASNASSPRLAPLPDRRTLALWMIARSVHDATLCIIKPTTTECNYRGNMEQDNTTVHVVYTTEARKPHQTPCKT